ncbi:synapsin-1-like isoform X1 [Onychomys torridus]|uniref:synapsin-1-like isoform X1 n=1 Tax=Onychomys torridus TaxID=38674 RepID=UPI00167F8C04|nr:synapsin-1-like isoform X1 [Onychomys torridus]XP_036064138.1 synapsin-1-like isoform X1 [Onychomys torridus]
MDRDAGPQRVRGPARSRRVHAPISPARDAPRPPARRALWAASARPGLDAQRSPGEGRRVPPPGPGAQTGESTRPARSPLPASPAAAVRGPRCACCVLGSAPLGNTPGSGWGGGGSDESARLRRGPATRATQKRPSPQLGSLGLLEEAPEAAGSPSAAPAHRNTHPSFT